MATAETIERKTTGKVRAHQTQNEGLVFVAIVFPLSYRLCVLAARRHDER